jgi:hypothetical protein
MMLANRASNSMIPWMQDAKSENVSFAPPVGLRSSSVVA